MTPSGGPLPRDRHDHRTELFEYLTRLNNGVIDAHRHKETLCWAISAFYGLGTVQVANSPAIIGTSLASRGAVAALYLAASLILVIYIRRQFNLRDYYVRMSATTSLLVLECLAGQLVNLTPEDMLPEKSRAPEIAASAPTSRKSRLRRVISAVSGRLFIAWCFAFPPRMSIDHFNDHHPSFVIGRARELDDLSIAKRYRLHRIYDLPYDLMLVISCAGMGAIFLRA